MKKGYLVLEDGRVFEGYRFGAETDTVGELVFNTSVCGYAETLTDPTYEGQLVLQTYPLIGNYGVNRSDVESAAGHVKGYIVRECCDAPSNFRSETDLDTFMKELGIPGLCGVDTRQLTRIIRDGGVMNATICDQVPSDLTVLEAYKVTGAVKAVTGAERTCPAKGEEAFRVTVVDYGVKGSILRTLQEMGCTVRVVGAEATAEEILTGDPDGILLSNGPGDPAENDFQIQQIKKLAGKTAIFAVGLGHQMLSIAQGGRTERMKYGHHGSNQPVRDLVSGRTYITAQNNLYTVDPATIKGGSMRYVNANDGVCEGIDYPDLRAFGIQFMPELCSCSKDLRIPFERFVDMMKGGAV